MKHGCTAGPAEPRTGDLFPERRSPVNSVRLGDGISGLGTLEAGSVDLVLSDLPSGATRHEHDKRPDLKALWPAIWGALRPDGTAVLMASSFEFARALVDSEPAAFRYDLIWHKSLATGFLSAKNRPLRAHEFVLVFSRKPGSYTAQMLQGATPIHAARRRSHGPNYGRMTASTESRAGATDRFPTSVLSFSSVGTSSRDRRHPQQKPIDLLAWLLRTYSAPGAFVADPFAGSGSTEIACVGEGRRFVGWDVNPKYGSTVSGIKTGSETRR
jgi:site-specific DNA-methyltransferase (adenine-specific)